MSVRDGPHPIAPPPPVVPSRNPPAYDGVMTQPNASLDEPAAPGEPGGPATQTAILERTETAPLPQVQEPGDHERFAHYADKNKIMESALTGEPVVALCGKVWVPNRDPQRFPVCPTCKEILDEFFPPEDGES